MEVTNQRKLFNQKGLTLIEVLVSLVIISIILLVVLFVLLQIIQTNKTSQTIVNATYVAQTEMEELYERSQNQSFDEWVDQIKLDSDNYTYDESTNESTIIHTVSFSKDQFIVEIKISEIEPAPLKRVILYILDPKDDNRESAKMENII